MAWFNIPRKSKKEELVAKEQIVQLQLFNAKIDLKEAREKFLSKKKITQFTNEVIRLQKELRQITTEMKTLLISKN